MKKILFSSFLCLVFAMFTNTVKAQECCFYLEQIPDLHPEQAEWMTDYEAAQFHLNPISQGNIGKTEYYYFRFTQCSNPKAKLSIDWEFSVAGAPWDKALDATATNPRNRINVEFEWRLPLITGESFQGSGPLLSGMGLNAAQEFTNINGVKRAVKTDFPGTIDASLNGTLFGYFNPYNVTPRWYNFFYADFLQWACENDFLRIKITRYSSEEVQITFKLVERTNGFDYLNHYIGTQQQDYIGGHNAIFNSIVKIFEFKEPEYRERSMTVCAGEEIRYGRDQDGNPYVFTNPNYPGGHDSIAIVYFYGQGSKCPNDIDKIVTLTIEWKAIPVVELVSEEIPEPFCIIEGGDTEVSLELIVEPAEGDYTYFIKKHHTLLNEPDSPIGTLPVRTTGQYTITGYVLDNETNCFSERDVIIITAYELPDFDIVEFGDRPGCGENDLGFVQVAATDDRSYIFGCLKGTTLIEETTEGTTGHTFYGLLDGEYIFYAIDEETQCRIEYPHTVLPWETDLAATATVAPDSVVCKGGTVLVIIEATGGTEPYIYYYAGEAYQTGGPFELPAGEYLFTVKDAMECEVDVEVEIREPEIALIVTGLEYPAISCFGETTSVTVRAEGGYPPYKYSLDGEEFQESNVFEDVLAGDRTFTVRDAGGEGCAVEKDTTIIEPPLFEVRALILPEDSIKCYGGTGTVTVRWGTGGTENWTGIGRYTVTAGGHRFTVTDDNGCVATDSIFVTQPNEIVVTPVILPEDSILCYGETAAVTVNVTGGIPPYEYYFNGALNANNRFEGILAGTHTFTVRDANNCPASGTITVTQPTELTATTAINTQIVCKGDSAIIIVRASGGISPYEYYLNEELNANNRFKLPAGTYEFTVVDANGCTVTTLPLDVEEPEVALTVDAEILSTDSILCYGGSATVTVTANGGEPDYTDDGEPFYTYYFGQTNNTTGTFNGVFEGTHTFTVTDKRGCEKSVQITVTQPDTLIATASLTVPISCIAELATITITIEGGTQPYFYNDEEVLATFDVERAPGFYEFIITDSKYCTASDTITVRVPDTLKASISPEFPHIWCWGGTTAVTINASGGSGEYIYVLNEVTYETNEFQLPAGAYTFFVRDANALHCETEPEDFTITTSDSLWINSEIHSHILCNGETATVQLTFDGGTEPYTYQVNGEDVTPDENGRVGGLVGGTGNGILHVFTIKDAKDCIATTRIIITQPNPIIVELIILPDDSIKCFGGTAMVEVNAVGGTGLLIGTGRFPRLAGTHTFYVTDVNGCIDSATITIDQPTKLVAASYIAETDSIWCYGETAIVTVTATGGTPPYTGTGTQLPVFAGIRSFIVTDANGCTDTTFITVTEPDQLVLTLTIAEGDEILCNGDLATITLSAVGGTGEYTFFYNGLQLEGNTIQLPAREESYEFTVIDEKECTATETIAVDEPEKLKVKIFGDENICIGATATLIARATGGTGEYTYLWSPGGETTRRISNLDPGIYTVMVTDENECVKTKSFEVSNYPDVTVEIDADKDCNAPEIEIVVTCSEDATITIHGYDVENPGEPIITIENVLVSANDPHTVYYIYSGTANFIYFVATADVYDIPCDFVSDASIEINYNSLPKFYAYAEPCGPYGVIPSEVCLENNYKEVALETPVSHYFRVSDYCNTHKDLHLSVAYTYWYKAPGATDSVMIGTAEISNFLFTTGPGGNFMRYTTIMECGPDVVYSFSSGAAYFPRPGTASGGWSWDGGQGRQVYDFFTLIFLDNREITVELPGFSVAGTYYVNYELITRHWGPLSSRPGDPYGNKWAGNTCHGRIIGGNGFYGTGNFIETILATRTMIIEVPAPAPAPNPGPALDINEAKVATATIYPNPTTDKINIKFENVEGPVQVRIANINGQIVFDQEIHVANNVTNINLPGIKPGVYFVNIISENAVLTRKLVVTP